MEPTKSVKRRKDKLSSVQILVIERMLQDSDRTISLRSGSMRDLHDDWIMWVGRGTINALRDRKIIVIMGGSDRKLILNQDYDFSEMLKYNNL